jgi:hypothetical protein
VMLDAAAGRVSAAWRCSSTVICSQNITKNISFYVYVTIRLTVKS